MKPYRITAIAIAASRTILFLLFIVGVPISGRAGGLVAVWGDPAQAVLPSGVNNVKALSASYHTLALLADGTVVAWGNNTWGEATVPASLPEIRAVAAGAYFGVVLTAGGSVLAWGNNTFGQLNVPPGLGNVVAIAAGYQHALALRADGTVIAWGDNTVGQTNLPAGLANVVAISCGAHHNLALRADGTVVAWGENSWGETNVPSGLSGVFAISAGDGDSFALKDDGTVVAWGNNTFGQTAVPIGLSNVVDIAAGAEHCLALRIDGTIAAWGSDSRAQTNVPAALTNVDTIAAGYYHSLAIVADGPVQMAAQAQNLKLAASSSVTFSAGVTGAAPLGFQWRDNGLPVTNAVRITGANAATLTISNLQVSDGGNYWLIVSNAFGSVIGPTNLLDVGIPPTFNIQTFYFNSRVGTNAVLSGYATGSSPIAYQWLFNGTPIPGANGTELVLTNLQTTQSGDYWLVATNLFGTASYLNAVLNITNPPPIILSQPTSRTISVGGSTTFSVQAIGTPPLSYQWTFNGNDIPGATSNVLKLGPLTRDQTGYYDVEIDNPIGATFSTKALLSVVPVVVWGAAPQTNFPPGLTNVIALADSVAGFMLVALKSDGTVANWDNGTQLAVPPSGSNFVAVTAYWNLGAALRSDGTVAAWLAAQYDDCRETSVPTNLSNVVAVATPGLALRSDGTVSGWGCDTNVGSRLTDVVAISLGRYQDLAVKSDGTVVAWAGSTNVATGLSNVIAVAAGTYHSLALKADGTVVAWGSYYPLPTGLSNIVAIAAGASNSLALEADGTLFADTQGGLPPGLTNVQAITLGYYYSNIYYVSSGAASIGTGSPNFTIQPQSRRANQGATVQFHARAVGIQPLQYQWTFNGTNLPGATTGDLTLTNVQPKDTGSYQVIASNALGAVASTSTVAVLGTPFDLQPASSGLTRALDATNLSWGTGYGVAAWFAQTNITHDGVSAGQSGPIGDSQQSVLQTTVTGPGTLTFWWKVSSEEGFDILSFTLDGAMPVPAISGEVDWEQETVPIAGGSHQLDWVYSKDPSVSVGQDAGWLDQVTFVPNAPTRQRLSAPAVLANGTFVLTCSNADGGPLQPADVSRFEAQTSSNLADWVTLPGAIAFTNGALLISDTSCSNAPMRFYRVVGHY